MLIISCARNAGTDSRVNVFAANPQASSSSLASSIDESQTVTLHGNVHPMARVEFDLGAAIPSTQLNRMLLLLKSSSEQQAALDGLVAAQQDPHSPFFHQWLTPAQFGARFGSSDADLALVSAWLAAHGFTVDEIPSSRRLIVFSGTAGQLRGAFHTELRRYRALGAEHLANSSDPQIPSLLAAVVAGVVSLHDFRRSSEIRMRRALAAQPAYSAGSTHYLFPADFATIYDLNPLLSKGINGAGASIAIAARSNINVSDVEMFRSIAGLPANGPTSIFDGADPGLVAPDQAESTLDVEWSGAVAPAASVDLVIASSTATTDGIDLSAAYIVNHATAPIVSVSYGSCEQEMGATELAFYNSLWEQAASQGMSVFVASGDAGAAGCAAPTGFSGTSAAVNGLCSSPYSTCVGGTEFDEGTDAGQFWSAFNSPAEGSALAYIPEEVWNESALNGGVGLWASGGGLSSIYAQPPWQRQVAGSANAMRTLPDLALAAADHDGYFAVEDGTNWIASGTSVSATTFAGLMALVLQSRHGEPQGNANPALYSLPFSAVNPFHPTLSGDNSVPGVNGFAATGGAYNLATGLGSVDAALLVDEWGSDGSIVVTPIRPRPIGCSRFDVLAIRCAQPPRAPP